MAVTRVGRYVVLSWGLGADSTAILLRWLLDPSSRDFDLADLIVLVAMTGDEWESTRTLAEAHLLPLLRAHNVRLVQVARRGLLAADGIVVLDDSRRPTRLYLEGAYKLSDELLAAGTVPQVASGRRRCSLRAKGEVLDRWIEGELGGADFTHVIGFNAEEVKRIARDKCYGGEGRHTLYPLQVWGWDRATLEDYIERTLGVRWEKSSCSYCPFSAGKPEVLARFRREPDKALLALRIEHLSLALNPNMTLYAKKSLRSCLAADGQTAVIERFERQLDVSPYAVYRVRRIYYARGVAHRSVETVATGTRAAMRRELRARAAAGREVTSEGGVERVFGLRDHDPDSYPRAEEMYVAAPAGVPDKERKGFRGKWTVFTSQSRLFDEAVAA